jgi:tRNA (uracil-5-)-methyltransferase
MPLSQYRPQQYGAILQQKMETVAPRFRPYTAAEPAVFPSAASHYRMRAEFRMWHQGETIDFVMFRPDGTAQALVDFPVASRHISDRMPDLKALLDADETLRRRLFQVEFLTTGDDDTLLTLVYHKKLDDPWRRAALKLQRQLQLQIIGRSRKQKIVLERDYVTEHVNIHNRDFSYRQTQGVFTQPNAGINRHMLEWVLDHIGTSDGDLLELYCGIGNFTLPLAAHFRQVLATEISKQAVALAHHNMAANGIDNLTLVRMSSEDFTQAIDRVRPFRRLQGVHLDDYQFDTVLVDPPRSGLDAATLALVQRMERIVYISCNPQTLLQNLAVLEQTHQLQRLAFFDQFPYTPHLECGVILQQL